VQLTSSVGQVDVDDASAEVTGISMSSSVGSVDLKIWTEVETGTSVNWTEVDTAA